MYKTIRFVLPVLFIFLATACDIGEDSCSKASTSLTITNIELDTDMPPYQASSNSLKAGDMLPDRRFIIAVYTREGAFLSRKTISMSDIDHTSYPVNVTFDLPEGRYRLVVWSDYVVHDSTEDLYYDTRDLTEITLNGNYSGNTALKDAYTAYKEVNLNIQATMQVKEDITLHRPFAKYQIVASDLDEYIKKGGTGAEGITTHITYTGLIYDSYNAVDGQPGSMGSGMSYTGTAKVLSANQLLLAWDYIWAEDDPLNTNVKMIIYDHAGKVINTFSSLKIPYVRAKYTTVTGAFLTDEQETGIGIITEYEGDINIPLP